MKYQTVFPASLLLLWTLTAFVSCDEDSKTNPKITVKAVSDGILLECKGTNIYKPNGKLLSGKLTYSDANTGEYHCMIPDEDFENANAEKVGSKIYVKFRTCDNCVELDESAIAGIVIGNVVGTVVIGVAVYLIASQTQTGPTSSHKKSSDRQHLVPNEVSNRGASGNDHYQASSNGRPLNPKSAQRDTYDVISNRR